jgi:glutaminyl-peptide cyclotransferase
LPRYDYTTVLSYSKNNSHISSATIKSDYLAKWRKMNKKYENRINNDVMQTTIHVLICVITIITLSSCSLKTNEIDNHFSPSLAFDHIQNQMKHGSRIPGSLAHDYTIEYIENVLSDHQWSTTISTSTIHNKKVKNIIGSIGTGYPWIILGAHYDSRIFADRDPDFENRQLPVPGANDGASGVAVLLELSRVLPEYIDKIKYKQIWLVFFDAEDNGNIEGWDWILGSQVFVNELDEFPDTTIIVDMVGDKDLNIYMEKNSDPELSQEIWEVAHDLGYSQYFIPYTKYRILDDHIPFKDVGVEVVDIIDFDYKYWHTIEDTTDKVSPQSLEIVGNTLIKWLIID